MKISAGVDEVGRGSLAGPVIASSVILDYEILGLDDSKKLSKTKREALYEIITKNCTFAIGSASNEEIDSMNIHNASLLAMKRSVENLSKKPSFVFVDGKFNFCLLYTSPSPRDLSTSRMPSSA